MPRPDRSRAALIDKAATLFRRQGYAATGLNQILAEAGVGVTFVEWVSSPSYDPAAVKASYAAGLAGLHLSDAVLRRE